MADYTPNKKLELPKSNEKYDVNVANKNNRVIDSELHKLELKNQSQDELLATKENLNSEISRVTTKLDAEISRAKSSENELTDSIENEINRAVTAEMDIVNELDNRLPLTGGTLTGTNPLIKFVSTGNFSNVEFANPSGHLFIIEGYSADDGTSKQLNVFARDWNKSLLRINENSRVVYDYKTNTEKELVVSGEALPITGGTLENNANPLLTLKRTGGNFSAIDFVNQYGGLIKLEAFKNSESDLIVFNINDLRDGMNNQRLLLRLSREHRQVFDPKSGYMKDIMVKGDPITPTVKETAFKIKSGDLSITGVTGSTETDITDIIIKAYGSSNLDEGMRVGISPSNGMGYIQAQNFVIDCNLLTLEETRLLQTFDSIRFTRANNSNDYPLLMPATHDFSAEMYFTNKDGRKLVTTKVKLLSESSRNYFLYDLPSDFKNDTASGNNMKLQSKEWLVATGIDVKNRN